MRKNLKKLYGMLILYFIFCITASATEKLPNLLVLDSSNTPPYSIVKEFFMKELDRLGFTQGKTMDFHYYSLGQFDKKIQNVWGIEKENHFDAIFVNGTLAAQGMKELEFDNPNRSFVFTSLANPVEAGLIGKCGDRPNHNFTGVCFDVDIARMVRFAVENMPNIKTIGTIYGDLPQSKYCVSTLQTILKNQYPKIELIDKKIQNIKSDQGYLRMVEFAAGALQELNGKVDFLLASCDHLGVSPEFADMVKQNAKMPFFGLTPDNLKDNSASMVIFPDLQDAGKKSAAMVKELFLGKPLKEIKTELAATNLGINLSRCKEFGIEVSEEAKKEAGPFVVP